MSYFVFFAGFLNLAGTHFYLQIAMLPTKCKYSDKERTSQAAKQGLEAVEDMFMQETFQYEVELKAEGLPINLSPLEAAMALAEQEEAKPLHKLSPVSVYKLSYLILKKYTYFYVDYQQYTFLFSIALFLSQWIIVCSALVFTLIKLGVSTHGSMGS